MTPYYSLCDWALTASWVYEEHAHDFVRLVFVDGVAIGLTPPSHS